MLQAQNRFEMMREYWRERFLETDQARLIEQFHLAADDQYIYIVYYEQRYAVNRSNGFISLCDDPGVEIPFGPLMSIYHLFCYSKPGAMNSGRVSSGQRRVALRLGLREVHRGGVVQALRRSSGSAAPGF